MRTTMCSTALSFLALLAFLFVIASSPAEAQKKKAKQPVPKPKQEQVQEEGQAEEQVETEEAPQQVATPSATPNSFKELVRQYIGRKTNLGILKKITNDYLVFDDDNVTAMYPMSMVQSIKLVKDDEASPARVEIKMLARD